MRRGVKTVSWNKLREKEKGRTTKESKNERKIYDKNEIVINE